METINGEWYMQCCEEDDPKCIHSAEELSKLISRIGFLPLFANEIPGFSVEERTVADYWWSGDPEKDPWEWRIRLSRKKTIAYGKFFNKKAGYVSKKWFPTFANYRRNGYDFEALVGDELATHRAQRIMNALELDEDLSGLEMMSFELKEKAGFGKGGEKNYEGVMAELQMQTYLLVSAFRKKVNKKGQAYGWHIAAFETPETKWDYDFLAEGYQEKPEESWEKIGKQVRKYFPDAEDKALFKAMGIRHPGESIPKPKGRGRGVVALPYPENLLMAAGYPEKYWNGGYRPLNADQTEGLLYALESLSTGCRQVVKARYEEHLSLQEIADVFHVSLERVRSVHAKAIRLLKKDKRAEYIVEGYQAVMLRKIAERDNRGK